jgi:hypothetical protein
LSAAHSRKDSSLDVAGSARLIVEQRFPGGLFTCDHVRGELPEAADFSRRVFDVRAHHGCEPHRGVFAIAGLTPMTKIKAPTSLSIKNPRIPLNSDGPPIH